MLRGLRNRKRDNDPRILILGLDNAGKTTILKKLEEFAEVEKRKMAEEQGQEAAPVQVSNTPEGPTQGFNIKTLFLNGRTAKMCDLGGQRSLREYWQDYYENVDCLMFVVDSSDRFRLEEAHTTFCDVIDSIPKVPVLVFANKQDLATAKQPSEVAEALHLQECRGRAWQIQGCSAKTGENLDQGLHWIMQNFA